MAASLIRSRTMITRALDRHRWEQVEDGAVLQEDGIITAVGTFADLHRQHPNLPVIGNGNDILLPGFINGHHHVGLTPVQHLHGWAPGRLNEVEARCEQIIRAYRDVGMRVSYSFSVRDQNRLVYQNDADFVASLPAELRGPVQRWYDRFQLSLDDFFTLFETLYERHQNQSRVKVQLSPANLHWCSDAALTRFAETSHRFNVPMHMHLVETAYQKEYARRRGGGTAVDYIDRFGLLGPQMTLGHGVWLNERDIDRLAETGTCICHNCSSNFRLRSGVAALNVFEAKGINTAIGLDEAGINDDRDMLQEMRMVLRAHRVPGMDDDVPTPAQVFRMATAGGAKTTPFGAQIGTLEVGCAADMVLIDWQQVSYPYLDAETPVLDAVLQRARSARTVICDGEVIYAEGCFTKLDRDAALRALHEDLQRALADDEVERRKLSKALLPHVKAFYAGYFDPSAHAPFYRPSSRI